MTTVAKTQASQDSHYYSWDGTPQYSIVGKSTGKPRPVTIRDARDGNYVPSVTTVLKILDRPQLNEWLKEQAALAVLTTPKNEGEALDAFVYRVLHEERQQDQESQIARDKGTEIHKGFEDYFSGQAQLVSPELMPWIQPAINALLAFGESASAEQILVGDGYAGRTDLIQNCEACWRLWDIKSTRSLPDPAKGAHRDHRLQLAAYGRAFADKLQNAGAMNKPLLVGNIYVSTNEQGQFVICEHEGWESVYDRGFLPVLKFWQWANNYVPVNPLKPRFAPSPSLEMEKLEILRLNSELIAKLNEAEERIKMLQQANAPRVTAPAAPEPVPLPAIMPGAMPTNPSLPTHSKDGKKIVWSTGVLAPSNGTPPAK